MRSFVLYRGRGRKLSKVYIARYYVDPATQTGYIYLPGYGVEYDLNIRAIMRPKYDGKWFNADAA